MNKLKFGALSAVAFFMAACGESSQQDPAPDMDEINREALGPAEEVLLTPISYFDVERYKLFGMGCNLLDDNGAMLMIAQADAASFLIAGKLVRTAADMSAKELPYGARTHYQSSRYSIDLTLDVSAPVLASEEAADYSGTLEIHDPQGRSVYTFTGTVQCGA